MNFKNFLIKELLKPLPGKSAHLKMLPEKRGLIMDSSTGKNASVCLIIFPSDIQTRELLFMKRTEYDGHHSGQVSFPGGQEEESDQTLFETAIRECYEETGIKPEITDCVGELSTLYVAVSGYLIHPFVFCLEQKPEIKIDPKEVQYLLSYDISKLKDDSLIQSKWLTIRDERINVSYFDINNEMVWGATAMILSEFIEILKRVPHEYN